MNKFNSCPNETDLETLQYITEEYSPVQNSTLQYSVSLERKMGWQNRKVYRNAEIKLILYTFYIVSSYSCLPYIECTSIYVYICT